MSAIDRSTQAQSINQSINPGLSEWPK